MKNPLSIVGRQGVLCGYSKYAVNSGQGDYRADRNPYRYDRDNLFPAWFRPAVIGRFFVTGHSSLSVSGAVSPS